MRGFSTSKETRPVVLTPSLPLVPVSLYLSSKFSRAERDLVRRGGTLRLLWIHVTMNTVPSSDHGRTYLHMNHSNCARRGLDTIRAVPEIILRGWAAGTFLSCEGVLLTCPTGGGGGNLS